MLRAASHLVIASGDVPRILGFFTTVFEVQPRFANDLFGEIVLPSGFRIAFFVPTGPTRERFDAEASRAALSIGLTVDEVDAVYARLEPQLDRLGAQVSGPPKDHPWGERSFLLTDPDGNRWEITQSPSDTGMLVDKDWPEGQ